MPQRKARRDEILAAAREGKPSSATRPVDAKTNAPRVRLGEPWFDLSRR